MHKQALKLRLGGGGSITSSNRAILFKQSALLLEVIEPFA